LSRDLERFTDDLLKLVSKEVESEWLPV